MLTDLEAVFRSLKSELGLRPVFHRTEARVDGHLFISVLAYQLVQLIRRRLRAQGISERWSTLRDTLAGQCRVTATLPPGGRAHPAFAQGDPRRARAVGDHPGAGQRSQAREGYRKWLSEKSAPANRSAGPISALRCRSETHHASVWRLIGRHNDCKQAVRFQENAVYPAYTLAAFGTGEDSMRYLAVVVLGLLLGGCATVPVDIPRGTRIAPVSLVGSEMEFRFVGTTFLTNVSGKIDVRHWSVDKHIEATATKLILRKGYYPVEAGDTAQARLQASVKNQPFIRFGATAATPSEESAREVAKAGGADYLLVIAATDIHPPDPFFGTNQSISGFGIYQRELFGQRQAIYFARLEVMLLDGRTGSAVGTRLVFSSKDVSANRWIDPEGTIPKAKDLSHAESPVLSLLSDVVGRGLQAMLPGGLPDQQK